MHPDANIVILSPDRHDSLPSLSGQLGPHRFDVGRRISTRAGEFQDADAGEVQSFDQRFRGRLGLEPVDGLVWCSLRIRSKSDRVMLSQPQYVAAHSFASLFAVLHGSPDEYDDAAEETLVI